MKGSHFYLNLFLFFLSFVSCKEGACEEPLEQQSTALHVIVTNVPDIYGAIRLELFLVGDSSDTLLWRSYDIDGRLATYLSSTDTLQYESALSVDTILALEQARKLYAKIASYDSSETVASLSLTDLDCSSRQITLSLTDGWSLLPYHSSDYSMHGHIHSLQTHTEGEGIRLVLAGDGFSDRQIASGYYQCVMDKAMEMYFSVSPFAEFRSLFDVWSIDAVSPEEGCRLDATQALPNNSAFKSFYGNSTETGGDVYACMDIAAPVLGQTQGQQLNSMMLVILNSHKYAGSTYIFYYNACTTDFGEGWAFSFLPLAQDDEHLSRLIHHEANGHGFAKLGDEYLPRNGEKTITASARSTYDLYTSMGWYKNIDITPDPEIVKWTAYIQDPDYLDEGIGVYEGANIFTYGFYRPTESSIMKNNQGEFNAPSREAIWYRIQKLAYGVNGTYDRSAFKAWDLENRQGRGCCAHTIDSYRLPKQEVLEEEPELPVPKFLPISLLER